MIEVRNLSRSFGNKEVIENFSYAFPDKGFFLLRGPNGCGKTTLLNILGMFDAAYHGVYYFNGVNVGLLSKRKRNSLRREALSYVLPNQNLVSFLTVKENITLSSKSEVKNLSSVSEARKSILGLSGGEEMLVTLSREFSLKKKFLLLDEVTYSLDDINASKVLVLLKDYSQTSLVLIASHDNRVLPYFDEGHIIEASDLKHERRD